MNLQTENCIWPRLFQAQLGSQIVGMTRKGIFSCSHFLNFGGPDYLGAWNTLHIAKG